MIATDNVSEYSMKKRSDTFIRLLLAISVGAAVFYTTPAWISGFCAAGAVCALLVLIVWRYPGAVKRYHAAMGSPWILALSLLITGAFGVNFYHMWIDSSYVQRIANILSVDSRMFVCALSVLFPLLALPCVACVMHYASSVLMCDYRLVADKTRQKGFRGISLPKTFWILCAVYIVAISAILRANFLYQDDAGRAALGYKHWDYFGRFLSTAMATIVHGGDYLVDAAPLPQLLAMVIMAASSVMMLYVLCERTTFSIWEVLAVTPMALNPYFLECISFRFDAPYMAMSVLGAVFPLLFCKRSTLVYLFMSALGVLCVCTSYQAATGIFPIAVILLALRLWNRGEKLKSACSFCVKSALGYGIGLLYFKAVLMRPAYAGYVSNSLPPLNRMASTVMRNLRSYYGLILYDFKPIWLIAVGLLLIGFVVRTVHVSVRKKPLSLSLTVFFTVLMLLLSFGLYSFLKDTLFAPRAMYGFGVLLALLGVTTAEGEKFRTIKVPALVLSWVFFVFSFTYGNALNYQREYTDFRIELVLDDLSEMDIFCTGQKVDLQISGSIGHAPVIDNMPQNYNMLNRLVPESFAGGDDLMQCRFLEYYGIKNAISTPHADLLNQNLPEVKNTMYHTIYADENQVLVVLK